MCASHEWILVVPDRRQTKWHLWHVSEFSSICGYADKRLQTLLRPAPQRRFRICQMCRRYAERNGITLPKWAITPNRKRATP